MVVWWFELRLLEAYSVCRVLLQWPVVWVGWYALGLSRLHFLYFFSMFITVHKICRRLTEGDGWIEGLYRMRTIADPCDCVCC